MIAWAILGLAVAVTLLTSLFKNVEWSPVWKNTVATVLSVISGGVVVGFNGDLALTPGNLVELALQIYGASQLVYHFIMQGTVPGRKLEAALRPIEPLG